MTALSELRASSAGQVQANLDGPKDGMHTLRTTKMLLSPIESTAAQPPAGAAIPRSLDSALRDSVIRQFYLQARTSARPLRRGPELQGSQNAEVSANCPLLQIPAHSHFVKAVDMSRSGGDNFGDLRTSDPTQWSNIVAWRVLHETISHAFGIGPDSDQLFVIKPGDPRYGTLIEGAYSRGRPGIPELDPADNAS